MGDNRLPVKPGKTEWLSVQGALGPEGLSFLVLDGVALSQIDLAHSLRFS